MAKGQKKGRDVTSLPFLVNGQQSTVNGQWPMVISPLSVYERLYRLLH